MTIRIAIVGAGKVADQNYLPYIVENDDVILTTGIVHTQEPKPSLRNMEDG